MNRLDHDPREEDAGHADGEAAMREWEEELAVIRAACPHSNTTEGVDEDGHLVESAYDICIDCGARLD